MEIKETTAAIADYLWHLLIVKDNPEAENTPEQEAFQQNPMVQVQEAGFDGVTADQMMDALQLLNSRMANSDAVQDQQLAQLRDAVQTVASQPRVINQVREVHEGDRVVNQQVVERNVENVQNVQNVQNIQQTHIEQTHVEQTFIDEGDIVTTNTTITQIEARGDVRFDQEVNNTVVTAEEGAVALAGGLEDSVINTGVNTGVIAGDDASLEDSIVGNDNAQVNDTNADALALGGDATAAEGENVNIGSGDLVDTDTAGEAQVVVGDENEAQGDVDLSIEDADGPISAAIGDDNAQQGLEDNSETIEDSANLNASTNDSGNTDVADSGNTSVEDNDVETLEIVDSGNLTTEDNDVQVADLDTEFNTAVVVEDNDETAIANLTSQEEVTVIGDANDLSLTDEPSLIEEPSLTGEPLAEDGLSEDGLLEDPSLEFETQEALLEGE